MPWPNKNPTLLLFVRKQKRHRPVDVPVKEVFSQIYAEKERIDDLVARLEQLEVNGAVASDNEVCLAMDARINSIVHAIWNDRDLVGAQSPSAEGPTLIARKKRLTEQRREFLKFRSEIQAKVGVDEQKIRKLTEDYLKTATTGDGSKQVRIELHSKAIRDLEGNQKTILAAMTKLKESDDGHVLVASKDQERIAHLEAAVQDLMARQVKEQKSSRPSYAEPQPSSGPVRGRSFGGSQKGQDRKPCLKAYIRRTPTMCILRARRLLLDV
eukprot:4846109-Amphidinium_carterae.1